MVLIHEKITALLDQRRLKKRDLARALGVSPQTATDICKGRSAITLPHLRNLVSFFEIRSEFWLDNDRLEPEEIDRTQHRHVADELARAGMLAIQDPRRLLDRLRSYVQQDAEAFLAAHPETSSAERQYLGLGGHAQAQVQADPQPQRQMTATTPAVAASPVAGNAAGNSASSVAASSLPASATPTAEAPPAADIAQATKGPAGDHNEASAT